MGRIAIALGVAGLSLISHATLAADLPRPALKAPVIAPPVSSWAGFYIGVNLGGFWAKSDDPTTTVFSPLGYFDVTSVPAVNAAGALSNTGSGFTGGGQAGFNWQSGAMVAGVEADFNYFGFSRSATGTGIYPCCAPAGFTVTAAAKTDWLATLRGRLGFANNNWLYYATGGAAFTDLKGSFTFTDNCGDFASCNGPGGPNAAEALSFSKTKTGWTAGGGIESKWGNWSVKAEYLYVSFDGVSGVGLISTPALNPFAANNPFTHSMDLRSHIGRLGLNYFF
jgi:outer membrane immunogenic protein